MIHWTWIVFGIIILALIARIWYNSGQNYGDYGFDIESPFLILVLIAFVLIWGGVFWW